MKIQSEFKTLNILTIFFNCDIPSLHYSYYNKKKCHNYPLNQYAQFYSYHLLFFYLSIIAALISIQSFSPEASSPSI
ncbi:hypothetical protein pb186bvf_007774 [Paramecium bursaria]